MAGEQNLAPERGPNLWDREDYRVPPSSQSRWRSGIEGAAVAVAGAALAGVGGVMVYRSLRRRARASAPAEQRDVMPERRDTVAQQSDESFPASDAPSWTPVRAVQPRGRQVEN